LKYDPVFVVGILSLINNTISQSTRETKATLKGLTPIGTNIWFEYFIDYTHTGYLKSYNKSSTRYIYNYCVTVSLMISIHFYWNNDILAPLINKNTLHNNKLLLKK